MTQTTTYYLDAKTAAEVFDVTEREAVKSMEQHQVPSTALGFMKLEKYYTFKQAAEMVGTSVQTMKRRAIEWGIELHKPGRRYLWTDETIAEYVERSRTLPK